MRLLLALWTLFAAPVAAAPALWTLADAETQITLFGTVHALPRGETWQTPAITQRLDAADMLVLEAIIPEDPLSLAPLVAEIGMRPGLKPLVDRVAPASVAPLSAAVAASGLPMAVLDRMESWLAAISLSDAALRSMGIAADAGVEPVLEARARAAAKPVIGLETPEQQLRYFDGLPEADQAAMLEATVADLQVARADTERLLALWRAGDVDTIAAEFAREARASPLLTKVLLTDRNARWADWIARMMDRPGKVFIAVGAGHFGGPQGLLALLKARGLTVVRAE